MTRDQSSLHVIFTCFCFTQNRFHLGLRSWNHNATPNLSLWYLQCMCAVVKITKQSSQVETLGQPQRNTKTCEKEPCLWICVMNCHQRCSCLALCKANVINWIDPNENSLFKGNLIWGQSNLERRASVLCHLSNFKKSWITKIHKSDIIALLMAESQEQR